MKNIKNLSQNEYGNYITLDLIPDMIEEYGEFDTIILKNKKIHFAKTCVSCGDLILIGKDYDLCNDIINPDSKVIKQYLEILTGLEVIEQDEYLECECFESEEMDGTGDSDPDDCDLDINLNEDTELDFDEDYGDGNCEE